MTPQVNVLLSAYNGSRFLSEQLDSIVRQTCPKLVLTVRDDGSSDKSPDILGSYASRYNNIHILSGSGRSLGVVKSFFELLRMTGERSQYFAFADQDDVWVPNKIDAAITGLSALSPAVPALYCSRVEYVDNNLRHLGYSRVPKYVGFSNALVENVVAGCTVVINQTARELLLQTTPGAGVIMHDWWYYLVVSAFGRIVYDPRPSVRYRQHLTNQIGSGHNRLTRTTRRIRRFGNKGRSAFNPSLQAREFLRSYGGSLGATNRKAAESLVASKSSLLRRLSYALSGPVRRQSVGDDFLLRILILLNRY